MNLSVELLHAITADLPGIPVINDGRSRSIEVIIHPVKLGSV